MRIVVIAPVAVVYDTGPASAVSQDQAIAAVSSWLVLPSVQVGSGAVAAKVLEMKAYAAEQGTNAQLAGSGPSVIKEPLA